MYTSYVLNQYTAKMSKMPSLLIYSTYMKIGQWIMAGQLKYQVDVAEGLENTIETYNRLFDGTKL